MKSLIKNILFYTLAFGVVAYIIPGFKYQAIETLIISSFMFGIISVLIKPLIKIVLFPLNFLTLGFLSPLLNIALIYGISLLNPNLKIVGFEFPGFVYQNISLPSFWLSTYLTLILASILISFACSLFSWFFDR